MLDYEVLHSRISDLRSKQVFFIGGAAKSGTTWLQILLDLHPDVSCNGEGHFTSHFAFALKHLLDEHSKYIAGKNAVIFAELLGYPQFTADHFLYLFTSAISLLLIEQAKHRAVQAIGEKTPDNVRAFALLGAVFPQAKLIHIVRDGRDCAVSGWFHNLRTTPEWTRQTYPSMDAYIARYAEIWAAEIGEGDKFGALQPTRYMAVRYEDVSAHPRETLAQIFDYLGVSSSTEIVEKCVTNGSFERLSGGRARGVEDLDSFFRKGEVGDWRHHLSAEMDRAFREKAGKWLAHFGYS